MIADLHSHSIFSDGVCTPEEVAHLAAEQHVELAALTDHNSLEGQNRFTAACKQLHIDNVAGVEISADEEEYGYRSELLAYFTNGGEEALQPLLRRKREKYKTTVRLALQKLTEIYHDETLSYDELEQMAIQELGFAGMLSHKLTYRYLLSKGYELPSYSVYQSTENWKTVWKSSGYSAQDTLFEIVPFVVQQGGFPVLPHFGIHAQLSPQLMKENESQYLSLLTQLKERGLWGIEQHPYRYLPQAEEINHITAQWAARLSLHLTYGSDYHGGVSAHNRYNSMRGNFGGFHW